MPRLRPSVLFARVSGFLALGLLLLAPAESLAARATPAEATAFIRLIGQVRVLRGEDERVWRELVLDLREVEVATGSGFIVSPNGWVITNHHVIAGGSFTALAQGIKVQVAIDVDRIEVVLPPDIATGQGTRTFTASVYASDPELDLAVLNIGGQDLPYLALGDSDAIAPGEPVDALGYPFGDALELGKPKGGRVPGVSVSSGTISALRNDMAGEVRYLQLSAQLNPGNSGGPIVDADGYALGVAQMTVQQATAIGFAIPINLVKRFLQSNGLDQHLPVPLLTLGPYLEAQAKGLRLRLPYGFEDLSPVRARVDSMQSVESLALRIDRVATGLTLEQLEASLLSGDTLESFPASRDARRPLRMDSSRRALAGRATGGDPTGGESKLTYVIVDLGREKLIARYAGSGEAIAINRSLLMASLASLEVRPLLTQEVTAPIPARFAPIGESRAGEPTLPAPAGWVIEGGAPTPCAGLSPPQITMTMSPPGDFTVALRAAWRPGSANDARAADACSGSPARGTSAYALRPEWLGNTYEVNGTFVRVGTEGMWQLEMIAPAAKGRFVRDLFDAWVKAVSAP